LLYYTTIYNYYVIKITNVYRRVKIEGGEYILVLFAFACWAVIIWLIVRHNRRNKKSTVAVNAIVIAKRISGTNYYYVTFDVEGRGRIVFYVSGYQRTMFIEGDRGILRYMSRNCKFLSFQVIQPAQRY
jgi:hypothetical protein